MSGSSRWDWAPHAREDGAVVFVSDRSGSSELWLEAARGAPGGPAVPRRLTSFGGPYVNHPRWSPGGRSIAFDARPGGDSDIFVLELGEGSPRRRAASPSQEMAPSWSPDGRRLYFSSDRSGSWQLWRTSVDQDTPRQVTRDGGFFGRESPDGRLLYFTRRHQAGIWRRSLEGEAPAEQVVDDLAPLDRTHWLLADDVLLYVHRPRHDRAVLVRHDLASGQTDTLGILGSIPYNSGLAFGADRQDVLFTRSDRLESDIMLLERSAG